MSSYVVPAVAPGGGKCCDCAKDMSPCGCEAKVTYQCRSRGGSATLCGFDEYVPSKSPKKYKVETLSGTQYVDHYGGAGTGDNFDCHGEITSTNSATSSGRVVYGFTPSCTVVESTQVLGTLFSSAGAATISSSATTHRVEGNGSCQLFPDQTSSYRARGFFQKTLSSEDKESDAIARASKNKAWTPWNDGTGGNCCAFISKRSAGVFTFTYREAEVKFKAKGAPNVVAKFEITFVQRSLTTGATVKQVEEHEISCDGAGDGELELKVPMASGSEVCFTGIIKIIK